MALLVFWIPIVTKKGGKTHNRIGWVYVYAMATVAVTALYLGIYRIFIEQGNDLERVSFSWFLIFISILSGASAWYGIRVLRFKQRKERHRSIVDLGFPLLLVGSGIAISLYGFQIGFPLLQYFPIVGIVVGTTHLLYWLRSPRLKGHWIIEHLGGMLACCISTITAFTVFGAPRLLNVDSVGFILWIIPSLVMTPLIIGFSTYYARKYNRPRSA